MTEEEKEAELKKIGTEEHRKKIRTQNERVFKWLNMLEHGDTYNSTKKSKLKSRVRKGIPSTLRSTVWLKSMDISDLSQQQRLLYSVQFLLSNDQRCDFVIFSH